MHAQAFSPSRLPSLSADTAAALGEVVTAVSKGFADVALPSGAERSAQSVGRGQGAVVQEGINKVRSISRQCSAVQFSAVLYSVVKLRCKVIWCIVLFGLRQSSLAALGKALFDLPSIARYIHQSAHSIKHKRLYAPLLSPYAHELEYGGCRWLCMWMKLARSASAARMDMPVLHSQKPDKAAFFMDCMLV